MLLGIDPQVAKLSRERLFIVEVIAGFLGHALARVNWQTDLRFQTRTTIDTPDYSGTGLNEGSKMVIAAVGRDVIGEWPVWETELATHPKKYARKVIRYAEQHGWTFGPSRGHIFGSIRCPHAGGCRESAYSTPRNAESHAR